MIIYKGKAKDYSFKWLLYTWFFEHARYIEQYEPEDFCKN